VLFDGSRSVVLTLQVAGVVRPDSGKQRTVAVPFAYSTVPVVDPQKPWDLWQKHETSLIEDYSYQNRIVAAPHATVVNRALWHLDTILRGNGKNLANFPPMPIPTQPDDHNSQSDMMFQETNYDALALREQVTAHRLNFTPTMLFH
jgi:hypothetical protein